MLKRFAVNIMQQLAPALMVVCILLCLSLNYTFPLHRHRLELIKLLNGSKQCGSTNRAKKMTPSDKQAIKLEEQSDAGHYYLNAESPKRKLSGDDLRQYEQLVIMKKYPYLDLKEFELRYRPLVKNAKYAPEADLAEGGNCELTDDGPHVEIFSRGISGFGIPHLLASPPAVVDMKLNIQNPRRAEHKPDGMKLREKENRGILDNAEGLAGNDIYFE